MSITHARFTPATLLAIVPAVALAQPMPLEDPIPATIPQTGVTVRLETVASGLTAPNWGINSPAGPADRLYVVDQDGILWAVNLASGDKTVFLDVSARLVPLGAFGPGTFDERGFLGIAFHPGYATNGLLYTFETHPANGVPDFTTLPPMTPANSQTVIAEWHVPNPLDPASVVDPGSARELLRFDKPQFNHNGGALEFGPDGMLYISVGDGGAGDDQGVGHSPQGNGQDITNILGDILRIDPLGSNSANGNYGIPADNPFVGKEGADEIFAYGMRNPFRMSFDDDGNLWVGDVGQRAIEEVDIVTNGGNYGWRVKEGTFLFDPAAPDQPGFVFMDSPGIPAGMIDPITQYDHDDGISVIGGFVYTGDAIPALQGRYVFGDFAMAFPAGIPGRLFHLANPGFDDEILEFQYQGDPFALKLLGMGQDAAGEVYALANATGTPFGETGVVLRLAAADETCPADYDESGEVNSNDYFAFLDDFFAGDDRADFNNDEVINSDDYFAFLAAFFEGCP